MGSGGEYSHSFHNDEDDTTELPIPLKRTRQSARVVECDPVNLKFPAERR